MANARTEMYFPSKAAPFLTTSQTVASTARVGCDGPCRLLLLSGKWTAQAMQAVSKVGTSKYFVNRILLRPRTTRQSKCEVAGSWKSRHDVIGIPTTYYPLPT